MAWSGKHLLCKHGALSLDPHHPHRKRGVGHGPVMSVLGGGDRKTGVGACDCNASAGEVETS